MSLPFLTIAIPTYNRLRWVSMTLPRVLEEVAAHPGTAIEVLVSDNCGSDGTLAYLTDLARGNPPLKVSRTERNLGAEGNVRRLTHLAKGRYLWLIGDDDLLEPGALGRVVSALEGEPDYLVLNYDCYNDNLNEVRNQNVLRLRGTTEVKDRDTPVRMLPHFGFGFLSCWVGKREFFESAPEEALREMIPYGMMVLIDRYWGVSTFTRGRILGDIFLRTRQAGPADFPAGFNFFEWFVVGGVKTLEYLIGQSRINPGLAGRQRRWLMLKGLIPRVLVERMNGQFRFAPTYRMLTPCLGSDWFYWAICLPVMTLPGVGLVARIARAFVRTRRKFAAK